IVAVNAPQLPGCPVADVHGDDSHSGAMDAGHFVAQPDHTAGPCHPLCSPLPHLAGAELRIQEALDETRLRALLGSVLRAPKGFTQCMRECLADGEPLDA